MYKNAICIFRFIIMSKKLQIKKKKFRKILRKSHPNFQHYIKKIEAQAKNGFLIKKMCITQ